MNQKDQAIIQHTLDKANRVFTRGNDIPKVVDAPLVDACSLLYNRNIQTIASSCNEYDRKHSLGHILINYDTLDINNQEIADELFGGPKNFGKWNGIIPITIPTDKFTSDEAIAKYTVQQASKFQKQAFDWALTLTFRQALEEVIRAGELVCNDDECIMDTIEDNYFIDPQSKLYFRSEEHYHKLKQTPEFYLMAVDIATSNFSVDETVRKELSNLFKRS